MDGMGFVCKVCFKCTLWFLKFYNFLSHFSGSSYYMEKRKFLMTCCFHGPTVLHQSQRCHRSQETIISCSTKERCGQLNYDIVLSYHLEFLFSITAWALLGSFRHKRHITGDYDLDLFNTFKHWQLISRTPGLNYHNFVVLSPPPPNKSQLLEIKWLLFKVNRKFSGSSML